jgi:hypothetical protein
MSPDICTRRVAASSGTLSTRHNGMMIAADLAAAGKYRENRHLAPDRPVWREK